MSVDVKYRTTATATGRRDGQATVGIGARSEGGFGITADLNVSLPGLDAADAKRLAEAAHQVCPYSNATRGNVNVGLTIG